MCVSAPITLPELFPVSEMPFCPPSTCWYLSHLSGSISKVSSSEALLTFLTPRSTFLLSRDHNCSFLSVSRTPKQQWNDQFSIVGFRSSVTKSCQTLCDPMDCSMPAFPVLHYLPEFAQTHIHWVNDNIQLYHPLSSPSPPALNLSQPQGLFQWVNSASGGQSIGASATVLLMNIQGSFPLGLTVLILQS